MQYIIEEQEYKELLKENSRLKKENWKLKKHVVEEAKKINNQQTKRWIDSYDNLYRKYKRYETTTEAEIRRLNFRVYELDSQIDNYNNSNFIKRLCTFKLEH